MGAHQGTGEVMIMETINKKELGNENIYPNEEVLRSILGDSFEAYTKLLEMYNSLGMVYEWRYYNDGKAWLCKVQKKKRTIVWMSAWKGYMQATSYFPLRLIDKVYELDLREETKERIRNTKNVGKSKPCIFEIRDESVIKEFKRVVELKIASR